MIKNAQIQATITITLPLDVDADEFKRFPAEFISSELKQSLIGYATYHYRRNVEYYADCERRSRELDNAGTLHLSNLAGPEAYAILKLRYQTYLDALEGSKLTDVQLVDTLVDEVEEGEEI